MRDARVFSSLVASHDTSWEEKRMQKDPAKLATEGGSPTFPQPLGPGLSARKLADEEAEALAALVRDRLRDDSIGDFCRAFAQAHGMGYGVAVNSGTSAVHAAIVAASVEAGDEVILTCISDVGSVAGILSENAIPVSADVDPRTCNIDPADVESKITDRTRAIMAVHLYGQPAEMDELMDIGRRHKLPVIEDCAQSHFAEYRGRRVGSIADIATFSFILGKHMTTVTGGMVLTNSAEYAERAAMFTDGRGEEIGTKKGMYFRSHVSLGLNYRMNKLAAAVGLVQLGKLGDIVRRRIENAELLTQLLQDIPGLTPPYVIDDVVHTYWLYGIWLENGAFTVDNYGFARALEAEGVPCMPKEYYLLYDHPLFLSPDPPRHPEYAVPRALYDGRVRYYRGMCPRAERSLAEHIAITWSEFFTEEDVRGMAKALRKVADAYRKEGT